MGEEAFVKLRETNYNENLADIVTNRTAKSKIYDAGDRFIQKADPVFMHPGSKTGRAQFFAPFKQIGNLKIGTLTVQCDCYLDHDNRRCLLHYIIMY